MDKYISFLLLVQILNVVTARSLMENYYWRDYKGVIPEDALPAGHDTKGQPTYVGQVLDGDKLVPGKINKNDENIYFEFGEQPWAKNENVKILCTDNAGNFEWIPTTVNGVHKLREEKNLIVGGYQSNFLTFIGRVHLDGRTAVGKVICRQTDCLALYTNDDGNNEEYHRFEILTYNPYSENAIKEAYLKSNDIE